MTTVDSSTPKTLIADDQPDVLEALRLLLKGEGFQTKAVTSPAAVIEALKGSDYDILLMDLNYARDTTSGQEGLDLLSHVQELDNTLPVVVMTAWGSVELAVEAMRRGVRDFVLKPWDNARLLSILRTQIQNGQTLRKKQRLKAETRSISSEIRDVVDLKVMLKLVAEHLLQTLECSTAVFFTRAMCDGGFCATARAGLDDGVTSGLRFDLASPLLKMMQEPFDPREAVLDEEDRAKIACIKSALIVPIKIKDELVAFLSLGCKPTEDEYDSDEKRFLDAIVEQVCAGINSLRLRGQDHEIEEAREIQMRLLPKQVPQIRGHMVSTAWRPASAVSGDYFDVMKFDDTGMALCIADVSGKGMPAALLMSNVQAAVKAFAVNGVMPAALCEKVNRVVSSNTREDKFITLLYCLVSADTRRLVYSNAGHNAGILCRRSGATLRLERGGTVLGPFPEWSYEQGEAELRPGDRVVLFTDGVTEVRNSEGEEFGEDRLIELLVRNPGLDAEQTQQLVMAEVASFSGGNFLDDATLIVLSVE